MNRKIMAAIMYDFDHTLSPRDMQEYSFIPLVNMTPKEFWELCDKNSHKNQMDSILSYMLTMAEKARENDLKLTRQELNKLGRDVQLYPGVDSWFERINKAGEELGIEVEHYVLSSGLEEIIEATPIAKEFKKIYACRFVYDENGVAMWPAMSVNYTSKTQFIYRINKGVLDVTDNDKLNASMADEDKRVPMNNMIYIGDGFTDVPCMKLVKSNGGVSITVYDKDKSAAENMLEHNRVDYIHQCDYRENSELENTLKTVLRMIKAREDAEELHLSHMRRIGD